MNRSVKADGQSAPATQGGQSGQSEANISRGAMALLSAAIDESVYQTYRSYLEALDEFVASDLARVYAPRDAAIQSIRKRTIAALTGGSAATEILAAMAKMDQVERSHLVEDMAAFVDAVDSGEERVPVDVRRLATAIAAALFESCGRYVGKTVFFALLNLPTLVHCGLDE